MTSHDLPHPHFDRVRSLVRYVDEELAVIEARFSLGLAPGGGGWPLQVNLVAHVETQDGFNDEQRLTAAVADGQGIVRLDVVRPRRWWPVGMGDQDLYSFRIQLLDGDEPMDEWTSTLGLTSVRPGPAQDAIDELIINGQACHIDSFIAVDAPDERAFLPVTGQSVLLVRGHYGPDVLYDAADRAGVLLIQCVPIDPAGQPAAHVDQEVDRLANHPSLAGWYVGHLGPAMDHLNQRIRSLDPTRSVFRRLPMHAA